jgi:hypothetical protein
MVQAHGPHPSQRPDGQIIPQKILARVKNGRLLGWFCFLPG